MSKPVPERFDSGDFTVVVNGETYYPHEGEWVELFPDQTVAEVLAQAGMAKLASQIKSAEGDPDEQSQVLAAIAEHFDVACEQLADRVMAWSWTDRRGNPLPQPDGTVGPIKRLSNEEMRYLLTVKASKQESKADRKNGSRLSLTSSSATRSQPSRASRSEGRSR